jgi:hypothetical protein
MAKRKLQLHQKNILFDGTTLLMFTLPCDRLLVGLNLS